MRCTRAAALVNNTLTELETKRILKRKAANLISDLRACLFGDTASDRCAAQLCALSTYLPHALHGAHNAAATLDFCIPASLIGCFIVAETSAARSRLQVSH
jgi:hypothetical protein